MTLPDHDSDASPSASVTAPPPLLQVHGLNVTYATGKDSVYAVRGVDLTLEAGQMLGMAGESGPARRPSR
jgi:ABC-type glutathione transport system ATPase component